MDGTKLYLGRWLPVFCVLWGVEVTLAAAVRSDGDVLRCYECLNTFKYRWDPYTPCQVNASAVPVATCLDTDQYCKVDRITVKGITIKIARSCAGDCYYGCTYYGYGVTQLRCTSCCNQSLCNTGSGASPAATLFCGSPPPVAFGMLLLLLLHLLMVLLLQTTTDRTS